MSVDSNNSSDKKNFGLGKLGSKKVSREEFIDYTNTNETCTDRLPKDIEKKDNNVRKKKTKINKRGYRACPYKSIN